MATPQPYWDLANVERLIKVMKDNGATQVKLGGVEVTVPPKWEPPVLPEETPEDEPSDDEILLNPYAGLGQKPRKGDRK